MFNSRLFREKHGRFNINSTEMNKQEIIKELINNYYDYLVEFGLETTEDKLIFMEEYQLNSKLNDFKTLDRNRKLLGLK